MQERDSLLNEVACSKSITSIKDKEHKIEINAMKNDLSNVLKDLTTYLRNKEKIVAYDTMQKHKIRIFKAKIQVQHKE